MNSIERHAGSLLDDAAEDVGVVAVDVRLAGLRDKGQRAEALHGVADGLVFIGGVPAVAGGGTESFRFVRGGDCRVGSVGDAGGVRQQVLNGDGAFGGNDVIARSDPSRRWSWRMSG